jgi:hypothetical protein
MWSHESKEVLSLVASLVFSHPFTSVDRIIDVARKKVMVVEGRRMRFALLRVLILVEVHAIATRLFVFYHLKIIGAEAKRLQYAIAELPKRLAVTYFSLEMPARLLGGPRHVHLLTSPTSRSSLSLARP